MGRDFETAELIVLKRALLDWYSQNKRDLPWRRTTDPYAIWLSETMLQQTRVAAVIPYYERFLALFPTVADLAQADEDSLLAAWAGLGYYYRARNLQKAAQTIHAAGAFPSDYDSIRALQGVGDYTAAAVASMAFNLAHAVVDGNVLRVLSRLYNDETDIASAAGRKHFARVADKLLDRDNPSAFNQSVMELGATVCLPKNPQCLLCPIAAHCRACQAGRQQDLPLKSSKPRSTDESRTVYWIECMGNVLAWRRPASSKLMPGFWELPENEQLPAASMGVEIGKFRHGITTHNYVFTVAKAEPPSDIGECEWLYLDSITSRPISTVFRKALRVALRASKAVAATVN